MSGPVYGANFGMPLYPPANTIATLASSARPRRYYCRLHGWNNSHDERDCQVMTNDTQYTVQMRNATSEIGSGGNPKIGVPVTYTHPSFFVHHITPCRALLVSPHIIPPTLPCLARLPEIVPSAHPMKTYKRTPCKRCCCLSLTVLMPLAFATWLCLFSPAKHLQQLLALNTVAIGLAE
jgi:hypothetical protein